VSLGFAVRVCESPSEAGGWPRISIPFGRFDDVICSPICGLFEIGGRSIREGLGVGECRCCRR
jgi:hypothetical protein